ncbi:hypothetical protein J4G33_15215 [Actinotalea sp. BY-33]|uniref:Uncharacterized protein n=1 Tax=Actinotalea soli TaxID=2819234 RepID=A0A939RUY2_9CELL|nr:hypothetical protein [Actinotalea soli]MBO1753159.1 hypothetical protein [Actinotalea soli]
MSTGGFRTGVDLSTFAARMRAASDGIEALASDVPSAPDAGAATESISSLLATLVDAVSVLSLDAQEAAARLDASATSYDAADQGAVAALPALRD